MILVVKDFAEDRVIKTVALGHFCVLWTSIGTIEEIFPMLVCKRMNFENQGKYEYRLVV
jgi:hypothetical protein